MLTVSEIAYLIYALSTQLMINYIIIVHYAYFVIAKMTF